jgi:CII-binding regulator of phage lambda lysogenization HflD
MADDDEEELARLRAELKALQREKNKQTHIMDQLSAEIRDALDEMRRDGVSEEEIQRMLAEADAEAEQEGDDEPTA